MHFICPRNKKTSFISFYILCILCFSSCILFLHNHITTSNQPADDISSTSPAAIEVASGSNGDYIKWVDFNITCEALSKAYELDVASYDKEIHLNWIELLAYAGAKKGGTFDKSSLTLIDKLATELSDGETTLYELTKDMDYYEYYLEAYEAVLGGMVGEYEIERPDENSKITWQKVYGLKAFSPIARDFPYNDYDDFGSSRSYGYQRQHLGHDMMGQIGTPI